MIGPWDSKIGQKRATLFYMHPEKYFSRSDKLAGKPGDQGLIFLILVITSLVSKRQIFGMASSSCIVSRPTRFYKNAPMCDAHPSRNSSNGRRVFSSENPSSSRQNSFM